MEYEDNQLATLESSGRPPETRVGNAQHARAIWEQLQRNDDLRARRRQLVKGLVDGNPPYRQSDLDAAGRSYQCNVNWREAESYFGSAVGAFYDLFNEAPTYATIQLKKGTPEQIQTWSRAVTTHFDWLCRYEPSFDYNMQVSQDEMVLYGNGPLIFQDIFDWRPQSLIAEQLKVPERTKSNTEEWELAAIQREYLPDELWKYIIDEKAARDLGWNVERVKQAIIRACPESQKGGLYRTWEWHQQQLKNGSIYYSMTAKTIAIAHLFFREFTKPGESEGKISHVMIVRDSTDNQPDTFLFQKIGRYDNWRQCIHPMYYDRGGGGFHHSVTGMGVKMYSAIEFQNRLLCNLADKAFTPKIMFKPTSSSQAEEFSLQQFGEYAVIQEGFEVQQTPIAGVMEEGVMFNREVRNLVSSNLSSYRTNQTDAVSGNPDTATQVKLDASKEASLQKTQMNRYYHQKDALYSEMYRRAVNTTSKTTPGGERAMEFIERCKKSGVPVEMMKEVEFVKASRVVGQGSEFLRQQSTEFLFGTVLPMLPENGRVHLIDDVIASRGGQAMVERYNPKKEISTLPDDQYAAAMSQVADMKVGVPAVPTSSQNPMIFASTFLQAADQAAGTLQQGANPKEVAAFLDLAGQAIAIHLQRMAGDPSRKGILKQMEKQWKQLAQVHDQLVEEIQRQEQDQQKRQQEMVQQQAAMQSDFALAKQKQDFELALKHQKTQFGLMEKSAKTKQGLAINDARAASDIRIANAKAATDIRNQRAKESLSGEE